MAINKFTGINRFLSNFCDCDVEYEGTIYPTTEHAFQAAKMNDKVERQIILRCKTPLMAKRKGRKVTLRPDWEEVKIGIMTEILRKKFQQSKFKQQLLETEDKEIVEGNDWHDNYWGKCFCDQCGGDGKNVLGEIIKKIREELRNT